MGRNSAHWMLKLLKTKTLVWVHLSKRCSPLCAFTRGTLAFSCTCSDNAFSSEYTEGITWNNPALTVKSNNSLSGRALPALCPRFSSVGIAFSICLPLSTSILKAKWPARLQKPPRKPTNKYSGKDPSLVFHLQRITVNVTIFRTEGL